MLRRDDSPTEPQPPASEPSLTEMLRRAQDARLGTGHDRAAPRPLAPRPTPSFTDRRTFGDVWREGVAWLMAGILIGALLFYLGVQANAPAGDTAAPSIAAQAVAATPTTTLSPTATTVPTATDTPAGTLTLTVDEIVTVVRDYIDNESVYTGAYELTDAAVLQTQWQGQGQLTACVAFDFTSTAPTNTSYGYDMRPFTLAYIDDTWTVTQLGDSGSCSMS